MFDDNSGWKQVKFGDVVRQIKNKVDPQNAGIERYVAGEHMDTDDLRIRWWGEVSDGYLGPAFHMRFRPGNVLYGSRRTYLRKVAVAEFEGVCANTTFVLESSNPSVLLPELLPFIMQMDAFHEHSKRESKGSVNPYVNFTDLARYQFALPPAVDQHRILSILMRAEEAWRSADYLAGSARVLFHSTIEHVHSQAAARFPLVTLERMVEPGRPITYGILMPGTGFPGGVPVIKVKDFPNGEILVDDLLLTDPAIEQEYRRSRLRAGDVLVSIRGTIGRVAMVPNQLSGANITQDTARLSFPSSINPSYIRGLLECATLQRRIHSNVPPPAPAGMPPSRAKPRDRIQGLNIGELRQVLVPAAPRQTQDRFAEAFETLRAALSSTTKRAEDARRLKLKLINQLLEKPL